MIRAHDVPKYARTSGILMLLRLMLCLLLPFNRIAPDSLLLLLIWLIRFLDALLPSQHSSQFLFRDLPG